MDASNILRTTMIAGLGIVVSSSTQSERHFIPADIECHSSILATNNPSSTRFNNSERFSLEQLKNNKRKLEAFKEFSSNWNGYNGETFDAELIEKVEKIISDLDYQPQVFPTGRGSIQIEKQIDDDNLVEIEISKDEIFAYQVRGGRELEKEISENEINSLLSELYV